MGESDLHQALTFHLKKKNISSLKHFRDALGSMQYNTIVGKQCNATQEEEESDLDQARLMPAATLLHSPQDDFS